MSMFLFKNKCNYYNPKNEVGEVVEVHIFISHSSYTVNIIDSVGVFVKLFLIILHKTCLIQCLLISLDVVARLMDEIRFCNHIKYLMSLPSGWLFPASFCGRPKWGQCFEWERWKNKALWIIFKKFQIFLYIAAGQPRT